MTPEEQKEIIKQAIKEWMDERAANFGWYLLQKLAAFILTSGLVWYIVHTGAKFP